MHAFEWLIGLLLGALLLSALARRLGVPYPTFLALGGIGIAFLPHAPNWTLEPGLALALFVAPVLLDAAFDTSLRDLRDNWFPVTMLVLAAVGVTTVAVAIVAHWLVPAMPWAAAIALGAIVAPPDAAAATAILRSVKLPYRVLKILEGESLLNDASALLIYRVAVGAAMASSLSVTHIAPILAYAIVGSLVAGFVFAKLSMLFMERIKDAPSSIIMQFAGTFLVWIAAEQLQLSGILTIVVYAITIARSAPAQMSAQLRVPSFAVWETVVFLLNIMAFVLIGMQLRPIWANLDASVRHDYVLVAAAVLGTVILVRIAWHMPFNAVMRWRDRRYGFNPPRPMLRPTVGSGLVISWAGMRGIVSLAAAMALPAGFPHRDLVVFTAFAVVLGTLTIQGLTLKPLLRALDLHDGDPVGHELAAARAEALRAGLDSVAGDESTVAAAIRQELTAHLGHDGTGADVVDASGTAYSGAQYRALAAARRAVIAMRARDEIGDDAFHRIEEELDWLEMASGEGR